MSEGMNLLRTTQKGLRLKTKLELGNLALNITRIVAGAGTSANPVAQTGVIEPKQEFYILDRIISGDKALIKSVLTNSNLDTGYSLNQIGIYAMDPDEGEILYMILQFSQPRQVPARSDAGWTYSPDFTFKVSESQDIIVDINPAGLATQEDMQDVKRDVIALQEDVQQALSTAQAAYDAATAPTPVYFATLPASGWSATAPYTQTVAVEGVTENWFDMDIYLSSLELTAAKAALKAWPYVSKFDAGDGFIIVCCYDNKPAVDIPVKLKGAQA